MRKLVKKKLKNGEVGLRKKWFVEGFELYGISCGIKLEGKKNRNAFGKAQCLKRNLGGWNIMVGKKKIIKKRSWLKFEIDKSYHQWFVRSTVSLEVENFISKWNGIKFL